MKKVWNSFKAAFAMFSKIPMPRVDWSPESLRYMLIFFPWVGVVVGALVFLLYRLCIFFEIGTELTAALLVVLPVIVTGGIHLDGFLDTSDAMASWQEREKRLEILKDSHTGAFAIINCVCLFVLYYGAIVQSCGTGWAIKEIALSFVISRCLAGLGVISFPKATKKGTVARFSKNASETLVGTLLLLSLFFIMGEMLAVQALAGAVSFVVALVVFLHYRYHSLKYFGGITGDLSGAFVCRCEVAIALTNAVLTVLVKA